MSLKLVSVDVTQAGVDTLAVSEVDFRMARFVSVTNPAAVISCTTKERGRNKGDFITVPCDNTVKLERHEPHPPMKNLVIQSTIVPVTVVIVYGDQGDDLVKEPPAGGSSSAPIFVMDSSDYTTFTHVSLPATFSLGGMVDVNTSLGYPFETLGDGNIGAAALVVGTPDNYGGTQDGGGGAFSGSSGLTYTGGLTSVIVNTTGVTAISGPINLQGNQQIGNPVNLRVYDLDGYLISLDGNIYYSDLVNTGMTQFWVDMTGWEEITYNVPSYTGTSIGVYFESAPHAGALTLKDQPQISELDGSGALVNTGVTLVTCGADEEYWLFGYAYSLTTACNAQLTTSISGNSLLAINAIADRQIQELQPILKVAAGDSLVLALSTAQADGGWWIQGGFVNV